MATTELLLLLLIKMGRGGFEPPKDASPPGLQPGAIVHSATCPHNLPFSLPFKSGLFGKIKILLLHLYQLAEGLEPTTPPQAESATHKIRSAFIGNSSL